ncbi:MAG: F510_1955 family glycosylhydrolase [Ornithinimicrobium sp.]|uniref:F510_1955 family glycosylhydrolase n=1 Tax=Ornithinimicrobium sp. TaxID=1977084 RepID=UPI003D9BC140
MHGLARDPADGTLYVGTHEGLFSYATAEPELVSPVMDFMGFAVAGPGEFVASGHPGPDVELAEPMGLIRSVDAGRTWAEVSRGGESDFHSLTASPSAVIGYDGALRRTQDGTTWDEATLPEPIADVALSPDGQVALITTESGLQRSPDQGDTWEVVTDAPLMVYADWADPDTVVGLSVDGRIMVSTDGASTFEARGEAPAADVVAFSASLEGEQLEALLATQDEVIVIPL